jgi:hypothetical protein
VAEVQVYSVQKIDEILDQAITGGSIVDGVITLTQQGGTDVEIGEVVTAVPDASTTVKGIVELATDVETVAGTDGNRAVTPLGLASLVGNASETAKGLVELATTAEATTGTDTTRAVTPAGLKTVADTKQPLDSDLTAIAALTGTNDNVIQRKSSAWTERTMSQLATDLAATGEFPDIMLHNGSTYVDADGTGIDIYIGPTDPASFTTPANGMIWFDTTGA